MLKCFKFFFKGMSKGPEAAQSHLNDGQMVMDVKINGSVGQKSFVNVMLAMAYCLIKAIKGFSTKSENTPLRTLDVPLNCLFMCCKN